MRESILNISNDYSNHYGEQYIEKVEYLHKVITEYETGRDIFNVLNFEAGLGKSYYTDRILKELYNDFGCDKKILIVKRFNEDVDRTIETVESEFLTGYALGINSKNWQTIRNDLEQLYSKKIIAITHQRYVNLCEDEKIRKYFTKGRHTLIIDEKINFPVYSYSYEYYKVIFELMPYSLTDALASTCKPLNDMLSNLEAEGLTNQCRKVKPFIHYRTFNNFKQLIETNIKLFSVADRKVLNDFLKTLELIYGFVKIDDKVQNYCVYNARHISTFHPLHSHWGLENNVILDASARLDGVYKINEDKYSIINQQSFIDHSESKFYQVKFNSSKSNIYRNKLEYINEIASRIVDGAIEGSKTLVVCHKDTAKEILKEIELYTNDVWIDKDNENDTSYEGQSIAISWYGNLIGKNWASKFDKIWLVSTPNIPMDHYLVHYMQYRGESLGNKKLDIHKGKFINKTLLSVQQGFIASEIYQSLKRIQRTAKPKGEFYIVNSSDDIIERVLSNIHGAELTDTIELLFVEKKKEEKASKDQENILIEHLMTLPIGKYKKADIEKELNIKNLRRILKKEKVVNLINLNKIKIHHKEIEVLQRG